MKIKEIINTPKKNFNTTNSGTIYSIESEPQAQDIVPQNHTPERIVAEMVDDQILEMPDHSAIAEGVSQIFRRKKKGKPGQGFRCTSGPRKGRIVAKPPVSRRQTHKGLPRSERRDSRRPDWQVRNLPKPNGRGQEQEDWQESRSRKEDKKARALHLK